MIGALLYVYILVAVVPVQVFYSAQTDGKPIGPPGSDPALRFLCGVFWPLFVLALAALGVACLLSTIARSFVVLWRHYIGPRVPRATARSKP